MPFRSDAQRRFLWAKHPEIARRWAHTYGSGKGLPAHVRKSSRRRAVLKQMRHS